MRIISGELKGKSLNFLKNSTTRPLKDLVKENIFNILKHSNLIKLNLKKSNVLDLYSGIGSFGIECLSRGVEKVTFVEKDKNALNILKKNLSVLSLENRSKVMCCRIEYFLEKEKNKKYNIIFFDPPFSENAFIENLNILKKNKMYETNHVVIIHRDKKSMDNLEDYIDTIFSRQYGRSKIIFGLFNWVIFL